MVSRTKLISLYLLVKNVLIIYEGEIEMKDVVLNEFIKERIEENKELLIKYMF